MKQILFHSSVSQEWFPSPPPNIFYSSTIVYLTGPGPVRQIKPLELFLWWILSFYWLRRRRFFFCCLWGMRKSERPVVIAHRRTRTICGRFCGLSGIKQKMFFWLRPGGHCGTGVSQLPFRNMSGRSFLFSFSCPFWFWENSHSHTMDSFIFLYSLLLPAIPPTLVPLRLAVFHPAVLWLWTKGPVMLLD